MVCPPLDARIDRVTAVIDVTLPHLQPQINFFPNPRYADSRILMECTAVSDFGCKEGGIEYQHPPSMMPGYEHIAPAWAVTKLQQDALPFQLAPAKDLPLGPGMVNVFVAGIQYGMPDADGSIQP